MRPTGTAETRQEEAARVPGEEGGALVGAQTLVLGPIYTSRGRLFPVSFARRGARMGWHRAGRSLDETDEARTQNSSPNPLGASYGAPSSGRPTSSGAVPAHPRTPAPPKQKQKPVAARSISCPKERDFSESPLPALIPQRARLLYVLRNRSAAPLSAQCIQSSPGFGS